MKTGSGSDPELEAPATFWGKFGIGIGSGAGSSGHILEKIRERKRSAEATQPEVCITNVHIPNSLHKLFKNLLQKNKPLAATSKVRMRLILDENPSKFRLSRFFHKYQYSSHPVR